MFKITYAIIDDSFRNSFHELLGLLPATEQQKILQIKSKDVQLQKVIARGILIMQLSEIGYPADILATMERNAQGKPYLLGNIWFNISHSHELIAVCISDECAVGLDLEKIRAINMAGFEMYFPECDWLDIQNSKNPNVTLLTKWTVKEAFLKARGTGFSLGTTGFKVDYSKNYVTEDKNNIRYFFRQLDLHPDYAIAFCSKLENPILSVTQYSFRS